MPALFLFLFKVNMALVLFCVGYYMVLRHLTFYSLNRVYLVVAILFSTLYPNINLSRFAQRHQQLTEPVQSVIVNWKTPAENFVKPLYQPNYWQWVEMIFWAGVILFAARLVMQLFSLYKLYRQSKLGKVNDCQVRLISEDIGPFSFWRSIYINPSKLSPSELKSVLEHEQIHVSQWHTLDVLLAELSTIFYWFNPGIWLMKKAVRENLEFITDRKILQKGADSKEYQYSLVNISLTTLPNTIVNHFNRSTIKKRIIMMNTKRSPGYHITRYLFLVPAVMALLLVFSFSKAEVTRHAIKSISTAISHVTIADAGNRNQKIITTLVDTKPALVSKVKTKSTDTIYSGKTKDGQKTFMVTSDAHADSVNYVINGLKAARAELKAIDPARITSIDILTAQSAKQFYPDLDNNRQVMFVTTDDSEMGKSLKAKIDKAVSNSMMGRARNMSYNISGDMPPPPPGATMPPPPPGGAITMAYRITSDNKSSEAVEETNGSKNATSVMVTDVAPTAKVKGMTTIKRDVYMVGQPRAVVTIRSSGDSDAPQVITEDINGPDEPVTRKIDRISVKKMKPNEQLTIDGEGQPLFIIDGKEASSLKNVAPSDIKSITVLKGEAAEKQYGKKGKSGVLLITTKKVNN